MVDELLQVWCNGYEAVAAHNPAEAKELIRAMYEGDEEMLEGEGWSVLPNDAPTLDEDRKPIRKADGTIETIGCLLAAQEGKPGHLWSCEV